MTETEGDHETVRTVEYLTGLGYYTENREGKPAEIIESFFSLEWLKEKKRKDYMDI